MRLLYNESECCTIVRKDRAIDKMIGRLVVRQYEWTCDARTILRLIARVLVRFKGDIYTSFSQLSSFDYNMPPKITTVAKTDMLIHGNTSCKVW